MAERIEINYKEIDDILYASKEGRVKFSVDVALPSGDIVVDIGFDGLIKGVEIMNASEYFSLTKQELSSIRNGKLSIVYGPSYAAINIIFEIAKQSYPTSVVIPYSKNLALFA